MVDILMVDKIMEKPYSFLKNKETNTGPITECAITSLSHFGLIRISGSDKFDFLQGQLTNDIKNVSLDQSQLSSYCTHKGRILASFRVFLRDDTLFFLLPLELVEPTIKRLAMFVLRSDVKITDCTSQFDLFEIAGDCIKDNLSANLPGSENEVSRHDSYTIISLPGDRPRFLVITDNENHETLLEKVKDLLIPTSMNSWALLDIRAGIPNIYQENKEAFIPQMVNFQIIDGVSFSKGCYTGQEVVARMHYLGKTKRRMFRARTNVDETPKPGDNLFSEKGRSGQGAGKVIDASPSPDGGFEILIVAPVSNVKEKDIYLKKDFTDTLQILDLPYEVNDE